MHATVPTESVDHRAPDVSDLLGSARTSVAFGLTVFGATVIQVLAAPISAWLEGHTDWPLPLPASATLSLLVLGCAAQAAALLISDRRPELTLIVVTVVYIALATGLAVPSWLGRVSHI